MLLIISCVIHDFLATTAVVLRKQMEKLPHYHFSWIISFQKQRYRICEMLPLETKLSGGKLLPQSDLRGGVFLEEMSYRRYDKNECKDQKEYHSYKIGTWNVRT